MNIHDSKTSNMLIMDQLKIAEFEVGSILYDLKNEDSDKDSLVVYHQTEDQKNSFLWEHHSFQYNLDGEDRIYTTIQNFIRNLMNGDSPMNFEIIHSEQMQNSDMSFLYEHKEWFYSYSVVRGFLGFAKRDLNVALKNPKRFSHAYRSYISAKRLLEDRYYTNDFKTEFPNDYEIMWALKNDQSQIDKIKMLEFLQKEVKSLREKASEMLDRGDIMRIMKVLNMEKLDIWLLNMESESSVHIDKHSLYQSLEKGIQY